MKRNYRGINIISIFRHHPNAAAIIKGSDEYPTVVGDVRFYQLDEGVLVAARVEGLVEANEAGQSPVFGFHIHSGSSCTGNETDPFADAMTHYNPKDRPHPHHAGDMPPLFGNNGSAFLAFITDRFTVDEIVGKTVIIHSMPDDFTTQPAGNAGKKIACGVIRG